MCVYRMILQVYIQVHVLSTFVSLQERVGLDLEFTDKLGEKSGGNGTERPRECESLGDHTLTPRRSYTYTDVSVEKHTHALRPYWPH